MKIDHHAACAKMARDCGLTGLSVLHRLYLAYCFNVLKDMVFDGMCASESSIILKDTLNKAVVKEQLVAMPWTPGSFKNLFLTTSTCTVK